MESKLLKINQHIMYEEVLNGLKQTPKSLPFKYIYDKKGSLIFEKICNLKEYYVSRTEKSIMNDNISEIVKIIGSNSLIIELGSGNSAKIRLLLDNLNTLNAYIPVDICKDELLMSVKKLEESYPKLKIIPVCTDYTKEFSIPDFIEDYSNKFIYFAGSQIGNYNEKDANKLLKHLSQMFGKDMGLLIGVDLKKDQSTIGSAYTDEKGFTADFILNILSHINNALGADFDLNNFKYFSKYNETEGQIEMYLISKLNQEVTIGNETILFKENEPILTEISRKYTIEEFKELVSELFIVKKVWTDAKKKFAIIYLISK